MTILNALQKTLLREAVNPEFSASFEGVDPDEHLYRSLGETRKDLGAYKFERILNLAYYMYLSHPLAKRIIELGKDFVIGNGIQYKAENPKIQALFDDFWNDSYNNFDIKQHQKISELGIYGEQIYPVDVNKLNGKVRLGYIDPLNVKQIIPQKDNIENIQEIKIKGKKESSLKVIHEDDSGKLNGDVFFFRIGNVSNAIHGVSDLTALLDWLDVFDNTLMSQVDRVRLLNNFVWDVTCTGMNRDEIRSFANEQGVPKPGSVRYHNENVNWNAVTPSLNTSESINILKFILSFMLGGAGIPEHFFALAYDINRATSSNMAPPFMKRIENRQNYIKYMFTQIFNFVIDKAIEFKRAVKDDNGKGLGIITESDDRKFEIILPDPSTADITSIGNSLNPLVNSLTVAKQNKWISNEKASQIFSTVVSELGVEIDYEQEQQKIKEEEENEITNDIERYGNDNQRTGIQQETETPIETSGQFGS